MAYEELKKQQAKARGLTEAQAAREELKAPKDDGLVDMKLPKKSKKEMEKGNSISCAPYGDGDKYPYGLELRLDEESFSKLGIELPAAGDEVRITAKGVVEEAASRETQDQGVKRSCTIQITKLKVVG